MSGYSIFISYAHEDEAFKNALTQQLKGLKRQGVIDPWDDRCIDGGDEWRSNIRGALDGCHLAVLLVSPAFIASDFIYTEELARLLERRGREGIRVVPIIVRPCAWKHEKPIESLQARPKDGKAIVTFPADDGSRDQAWSDIVDDIARWATEAPQAATSAPSGEAPIASLLARLSQALAANKASELDEPSRQRVLRHPPGSLDEYRVARFAEWSQRRYAVDKRFTRLALLVDQGPEAQGARWQEQQREFLDLREVLGAVEQAAVVLLGPPGCGKSTLLRRLELDLAVDALREPSEARISLFLPLSRYRPAQKGTALPTPHEWIAQEWQRPQHRQLPSFAEVLGTGRLILLLDAINEMPHTGDDDYRERIERWSEFLADLVHNAPGTRVVFSCRSLDYSAPLSTQHASVPHVRIKAMSDPQVEDFLTQYSPEHGAQLWRELRGTPQLEVFRSPFYLKLLVEQPAAEARLRTGRAALFTSFVRGALRREIESKNPLFLPEALLTRRDYERIVAGDWADAYELAANSPLFDALADFAARLQERCATGNEARVRVKYAEAVTLLSGTHREDILEAGAALHVLDIARDDVLFVHQLVQEYFAGRALAAAPRPELARVAWRADEMTPNLQEVLASLADSDPLPAAPSTGWEETFVIAAAMAPDADAFVGAVAKVNLPLAGRCAAQPDVTLSRHLRQHLQGALVERSREPQADLRARIAAARALGELGDPRFERRTGPHGDYLLPPMVAIAGGAYTIGSDEGHYEDEAPIHSVTVAPFNLGKFPVTNAEWRLFMDAGGYDDARWWDTAAAERWRNGEGTAEGPKEDWRNFRKNLQKNPGRPRAMLSEGRITSKQAENWEWYRDASEIDFEQQLDEWYPSGSQTQPAFWDDPSYNHPAQPVVGICWYEARAYCAWLSAQSAQIGAAHRLPTETEWEAAARGLTGAWGDGFDVARCNAFETHVRGTTPIGVFPGGDTPEGLADMTGNVWDWTTSLYQPYPYAPDDGREDREAEGPRVLRGGSWVNDRILCRCACRQPYHPGDRSYAFGFRVCCAPPSRTAGR